ncbi:MAG: hypothetical protein ACOZBH_01115 [Patescibacteria group bacterium]
MKKTTSVAVVVREADEVITHNLKKYFHQQACRENRLEDADQKRFNKERNGRVNRGLGDIRKRRQSSSTGSAGGAPMTGLRALAALDRQAREQREAERERLKAIAAKVAAEAIAKAQAEVKATEAAAPAALPEVVSETTEVLAEAA